MVCKVFTIFDMSLGIAKVVKFGKYSFPKEFTSSCQLLIRFTSPCVGFNISVQLFHDFFQVTFLAFNASQLFWWIQTSIPRGFFFFSKTNFLG